MARAGQPLLDADRRDYLLVRIDHVALGVRDLESAAERLMAEYGFGSFPGGVHPTGTKNWNVPLSPPPQYLELVAVDDVTKPSGAKVARKLDDAEPLLGWAIEVDDLDLVAQRVGIEPVGGEICVPDGTIGRWGMVVGDPEFPFFIRYGSDRAERRERWAKLYDEVRHANPPGSYAWVEVGGDEAALREWIGGDLPVRFVGGAPGLRAAAIESPRGEIVFR